MRKIISKSDRKQFYWLSKYILFAYVAMFAISLISAILNYLTTKNSSTIMSLIALVLATAHTGLILINWFAIKLQKSRIDYVKSSVFSMGLVIVMDVFSTINIVCNTITALINGGVIVAKYTWVLPAIGLISAIVAIFNLGVAVYLVCVAKKSVKENRTI